MLLDATGQLRGDAQCGDGVLDLLIIQESLRQSGLGLIPVHIAALDGLVNEKNLGTPDPLSAAVKVTSPFLWPTTRNIANYSKPPFPPILQTPPATQMKLYKEQRLGLRPYFSAMPSRILRCPPIYCDSFKSGIIYTRKRQPLTPASWKNRRETLTTSILISPPKLLNWARDAHKAHTNRKIH